MNLRDYQSTALSSLGARVRAGVKRLLLVAPTGSGKTTIAAEMIRDAVGRGGSVLFLAHRKELIDQCVGRLKGVGVKAGVVMAGYPRHPRRPVQVASIPTLVRRPDRPPASLVIVDEAHHARAGTYASLLAHYPDAPVIGLTATPWRLDNRGLGELFEEIVVASTPRELVAAGHLVPFTGFAYDIPDLKGIRKIGADYDQRGIGLVMGGTKLAGNIIEQWLLHCAGKRTVVFAVSVDHSQKLAQRFRDAGVRAEHLDGMTPTDDRKAILKRLASGKTQVVCNVNVLTEGWDLPALEVCVLARPTLSVGLYLQMVGRVMRPFPGKTVARIHDHAGCILRHGLPDQDRTHSLSMDVQGGGARGAAEPLRTCAECAAVYPAALRECPACGAAHPVATIEEVEGVGIPLEDLKPGNDRYSYLEQQLEIARATGRKPGWAAFKFKERFGEWPSSAWWAQTKQSNDRAVAS